MAEPREPRGQQPVVDEPAGARGMFARLRNGVRASRVALVVILPAAGVLFGVAWYWLEPVQSQAPGSRLGQGSVVTANPLEATSHAYRQALEQGEANRRERALSEGESYVPAFQSQTPRPVPVVSAPILPRAVAPSDAMRAQVEAPDRAETTAPGVDPLVHRDYPEPEPRGTALVRDEVAPVAAAPVAAMVDELLAAWNTAPKMAVIRYDVEPHDGRENREEPTGTEAAKAADSAADSAPGRVLGARRPDVVRGYHGGSGLRAWATGAGRAAGGAAAGRVAARGVRAGARPDDRAVHPALRSPS